MADLRTVTVETPVPYPVRVGPGAHGASADLYSTVGAVIADEEVHRLHGSGLSLDHLPLHLLPRGEAAKTLTELERALDFLCEQLLDRETTLLVLGGGAATDLGGLAAAMYLRGVAWIACPTTLLAMVDASVGGKTAVNLKSGKNLAGSFHQPVAVIADTDVLATLPAAEYLSGESADGAGAEGTNIGCTVYDRIAARSAAFQSVDSSAPKAWVFSEEAGDSGDIWNLFCEVPKMVGDPESEHPENVDPVQGRDSDGVDLYDAISIQAGTDPYGDDGSDAIFITVVRRGQRMVPQEVTDYLTGEVTQCGEALLTDERGFYETVGWARLSSLDVNVADAGQFIQRLRQTLGQYRRSHPISRVFDNDERQQQREDHRAASWGRTRKAHARKA